MSHGEEGGVDYLVTRPEAARGRAVWAYTSLTSIGLAYASFL